MIGIENKGPQILQKNDEASASIPRGKVLVKEYVAGGELVKGKWVPGSETQFIALDMSEQPKPGKRIPLGERPILAEGTSRENVEEQLRSSGNVIYPPPPEA